MTPLLRLSYKEPRYLQRYLRKWYRLLRLGHWTVDVEMVDEEQMDNWNEENTIMAEVVSAIPHRRATIRFNQEIGQQDAEWYVVHEYRHLHYAEIEQVFHQAWNELSGKAAFLTAHKMLMDKIEELCERDAAILLEMSRRL